ncbi:hypothetical protein, partial [Mycolicibacterium smegmatis]
RYQAKGRVSGLRIASQSAKADTAAAPAATANATGAAAPQPRIHSGTPGLSGATIDFDATHTGGTATLAIAQGTLEFPGVFDEPVI